MTPPHDPAKVRLPLFLPGLLEALTQGAGGTELLIVDDGSGQEEQTWLAEYVKGLQAAHKALDEAHDAYYALVGLATAKPLTVLKGHKGTVGDIRFAPVGTRLCRTEDD